MNTLKEATGGQRESIDRLLFEAWGAPITLSQFLARQKCLQSTPWAREREKTWVLNSQTGEILSSCESLALHSHFQGKSGRAYAIASVYTEPSLRKRGHAEMLLKLLFSALKAQHADTQAFILF